MAEKETIHLALGLVNGEMLVIEHQLDPEKGETREDLPLVIQHIQSQFKSPIGAYCRISSYRYKYLKDPAHQDQIKTTLGINVRQARKRQTERERDCISRSYAMNQLKAAIALYGMDHETNLDRILDFLKVLPSVQELDLECVSCISCASYESGEKCKWADLCAPVLPTELLPRRTRQMWSEPS